MSKCYAVQHSDQMVCEQCCQSWDVNDGYEPKCNSVDPECKPTAVVVSLRDQFAMAALQGIMANPSGPIQSNGMNGWGWCNCSPSDVTNLVYSMADAMLKEREDNC